jgi:hypothetical protein
MHRLRSSRAWLTLVAGAAGGPALLLAWPGVALADQLNEKYQAPLPLVIYVGGAALAVAMSFVFVILRNAPAPKTQIAGTVRQVPRWLLLTLQAMGLIAWLWIAIQALSGGSSDADVASLFLWVYGWVGLALISALGGPIWSWIDPFSTIHAEHPARGGRGRAHRGCLVGSRGDGRPKGGTSIRAQLPLAALMVALTTITLWSLGQAVLVTPST